MQELEKILEEIEKEAICISSYYVSEKFRDKEDSYVPLSDVNNIIRKHMNDDQCAECSRRKWHPKGFEDGKKNDGWIPVGERLPEINRLPEEDDECPEFNVTIRGAEKATTLRYSPADSTWFNDNGYVYGVTAWQPLPEPYRPERSDNHDGE